MNRNENKSLNIEENNSLLQKQSTMFHVLTLTFLLLLSAFTQNVSAAGHAEKECFGYVQDKIKWNYDHNARWEPENIQQLCQGTTQYKEPLNNQGSQ